MEKRIDQQIAFITEVDKQKNIFRQSYLADGSRHENDAEHAWHLALMAIILGEHANEAIDVLKVVKMVLIHDLVEIDAGDTYAYDVKANEDKYMREVAAAHRIFGLLPNDQNEQLYKLWEEFEARETKEAKFAAALDRVQPILLNYLSEGKAWLKHGISRSQVEVRNEHTSDGSATIWNYICDILDAAVKEGYLKNE